MQDLLPFDMPPVPMGESTIGGAVTKRIVGDTTIPTKKAQTSTAHADNQPERSSRFSRASDEDDATFAAVPMDGIPPAPRGVPQTE